MISNNDDRRTDKDESEKAPPIKLKPYRFDKHLTGATVSYKLDGVQAIMFNSQWLSRAGKPLYNLPSMPDGIYEVYHTNWETTITAVRTKNGEEINKVRLFRLDVIEECLVLDSHKNTSLNPRGIQQLLAQAVKFGYEGLVITSNEGHFKVKTKETHDVRILGVIEGTGRNKDRLGAFMTERGKVGTGLTDADRDRFYRDDLIGTYIEVECMELTKNGKFRHPRFIRIRPDK